MKNEETAGPAPENSPRRCRFNFNYTPPAPATPVAPASRKPVPPSADQPHLAGRKPRLYEKSGPLIFNVSSLLREPEGARREYDFEQDRLPIAQEAGDKPDEATAISGHIRFSHIRHDVLTQGQGQANVILECVRCLQDFDYHVKYDIEEVFRPSLDIVSGKPVKFETLEEEADLKIDSNHLLNLGEAIRQQILVNLPLKPVCRDDCPGLTAILEDINAHSTIPDSPAEEPDAPEEPPAFIDPRWAALTAFLQDDPGPPPPAGPKRK